MLGFRAHLWDLTLFRALQSQLTKKETIAHFGAWCFYPRSSHMSFIFLFGVAFSRYESTDRCGRLIDHFFGVFLIVLRRAVHKMIAQHPELLEPQTPELRCLGYQHANASHRPSSLGLGFEASPRARISTCFASTLSVPGRSFRAGVDREHSNVLPVICCAAVKSMQRHGDLTVGKRRTWGTPVAHSYGSRRIPLPHHESRRPRLGLFHC